MTGFLAADTWRKWRGKYWDADIAVEAEMEKIIIKNTIVTRKDMTHSVISIDSILLNSMRNGEKKSIFRGRKKWA